MNEHDILCPYCPDGIPMQMTIGGTQMRCPRCGSTSPSINDLHTAYLTPADIVHAAARRRYVQHGRYGFVGPHVGEVYPPNAEHGTCSACKERILIDPKHKNFCPECGVKIDGGEQNADND